MYKINTSKDLSGEVVVSGSKNAALPILAATLLVRGKITLKNVPRIGDVMTFLEIISTIGVEYSFQENTLFLDTTHLDISKMDVEMIKKIRASILLLSPILHYFGNISIPFPGGCSIGKRPIDAHLNGLKAIGYDYVTTEKGVDITGKPNSGDITINAGFGVTSTENLIVANVLRPGVTTIELSAIEPHVMNLIGFLREAGADIKIRYNHKIIVTGVAELKKELTYEVISDYIESGTFMVLGALASKEYIDIKNARIDDLYSFIAKLKEAGVQLEDLGNDTLRVFRSKNLKNVSIQTNIFPGFPTDIGSPFAVLMTQAEGTSRIHEVLFEGRLNFLVELDKMRGHTAILNPHEALIFGKMNLKGAQVTSWDLRAGAAMVIAGLIAEGETKVMNIEYIERGYENFVQKLQKLGAKIEVSL
ncbi:MAG: UDP-N-acetylglucosamine 1-carboxyvinyltransferase [Candidatus Altimarinota bacterium]